MIWKAEALLKRCLWLVGEAEFLGFGHFSEAPVLKSLALGQVGDLAHPLQEHEVGDGCEARGRAGQPRQGNARGGRMKTELSEKGWVKPLQNNHVTHRHTVRAHTHIHTYINNM